MEMNNIKEDSSSSSIKDKEGRRADASSGGGGGALCRCVCIARRSIPGTSNGKSVIVLPPDAVGNEQSIHVVQLPSQVCVGPREKYVVHLTTAAVEGSEGLVALRRAVSRLYVGTSHGVKEVETEEEVKEGEKERAEKVVEDPVDWSGYFVEERGMTKLAERDLPENVHCRRRVRTTNCGCPIDVDVAFREAERMFFILCPKDSFLPERSTSSNGGAAQGEKEEEEDSDMSGLDSDDDYGV
jgi:hypothetical protein